MMHLWTMRLVAVNVVMFFLTTVSPEVTRAFMFVPALLLERPWTLVTYMFLHGGTFHLLFNMLGLFFFGPRLEDELGSRDFLFLYFLSGITGALLSFVTPTVPIVGASGAVYGVFLGFARFWPRERILIWGILPVEARTLVIVMTAMSVWGGISGGGNIAHFAHLGGFLGGYLFLRLRESRTRARQQRFMPPVRLFTSGDVQRWRSIDRSTMHEVNRDELERILAKIDATGIESLTAGERQFLERFSAL